jgi:hypothetical protein
MKTPQEDPKAKALREREMRTAAGERRQAAQRSAASQTLDYRAAYGRPSLVRSA